MNPQLTLPTLLIPFIRINKYIIYYPELEWGGIISIPINVANYKYIPVINTFFLPKESIYFGTTRFPIENPRKYIIANIPTQTGS